jgi:hypothetical protein
VQSKCKVRVDESSYLCRFQSALSAEAAVERAESGLATFLAKYFNCRLGQIGFWRSDFTCADSGSRVAIDFSNKYCQSITSELVFIHFLSTSSPSFGILRMAGIAYARVRYTNNINPDFASDNTAYTVRRVVVQRTRALRNAASSVGIQISVLTCC